MSLKTGRKEVSVATILCVDFAGCWGLSSTCVDDVQKSLLEKGAVV